MPSTLIAVAPNGARKNKLSHPAIPLTVKEIGLEAKACMLAGAGMIHLHVRNEKGEHSLSVERYKDAIDEIEQKTNGNIFIQATTEAVGKYSPDEQFGMVHLLKPPAVSISLREIKSLSEIDINENFALLRKNNIFPQLILYNHLDIARYHAYLDEGILPGTNYPVLLVLGKTHAHGAFELDDLKSHLSIRASSVMVCAFGADEYPAAQLAIDKGWHARIGFENNELLKNKVIAKDNAELISQITTDIKNKEMKLANKDEAIKIMTPNW